MSNTAGRHTRPLEDFARMVWRRFYEDRCVPIAASLTFTTLLAIVPMITVALTVASALPVFGDASSRVETFLLDNLIPESARSIAVYAQQFSDNASRLTAAGLVLLFVTAMIVLMTIDRALNQIWRVPRPRPALQRVFIYCGLLIVGPILIGVSLSLTSWLVSASLGLVREVPYAVLLLLRIVPLVLTGLAFALLYVALPNRRVLWRDALAGGFLAAAAFEAMKHGFAFYISRFPNYKLVYGAFAAIPIFLVWIYLSWLVALFGAVAAAVLPEWRERASQVEFVPGVQFLDALQVLRALWETRGGDTAMSERELHGIVKLPLDRLDGILDAMSAVHWIERGRGGWTLARSLSAVSVAEVWELFVFRGNASLPVRESGHELDRHMLKLADEMREHLGFSVETLLERTASRA